MRTRKIGIIGLLLLAAPGLGLSAGCGKKDSTYTAAPPAGANAHAPPPVHSQYSHPKLPPLVDKSGKRTGGGDI